MDLKLNGNSQYNIQVRDENNPTVFKYYHEYDVRLLKSAWKQTIFNSKFFKTPNVLSINDDKNDISSFEMQYIKGNSFVEFFSTATKNDLDLLIEKIDGYFSERIKEEKIFPIDIFFRKLHQIDAVDYEFIFNNLNGIRMFVGECHGDMTFSNMIFQHDIYLIDFLDSFIESPTMDLIKLRQDTHLYYSLNMVKDKGIDLTKIKMCFNYIDEWLVSKYPIENYRTLQTLNLLRIHPYIKQDDLRDFVQTKINELWQH